MNIDVTWFLMGLLVGYALIPFITDLIVNGRKSLIGVIWRRLTRLVS